MPYSTSGTHFRFGRFVLGDERLQAEGATVHVAAKPLGVLRALVARAGETVDKDDLIVAVWGDRPVSDESLSRTVFLLRQALGDNDCERSRYVETVSGRGYRFVAPVTATATPRRASDCAPARELATRDPRQRAARELCLRARLHLARGTTNVPAALALFEQAVATDPTYAPGLAGLGECNLRHASSGAAPPRDAVARARIALEDAVRLDPSDGRSHACLARVHGEFDFDLRRAERGLERGMLADPADPWVRWIRARHFITTGRFQAGLDEFDGAATLDPSNPALLADRALAALYAGRVDAALERAAALETCEMPAAQLAHAVILAIAGSSDHARRIANRLLERPRANPLLRPVAGIALATAGDLDGARAQLALACDEYARGHHFVPTFVALLAAELGDRSAAYRWLETALDDSCPLLVLAGVFPPFRRLRGDPEYRILLRRIGREFLLDGHSTEKP